jgi:hypothetical protein
MEKPHKKTSKTATKKPAANKAKPKKNKTEKGTVKADGEVRIKYIPFSGYKTVDRRKSRIAIIVPHRDRIDHLSDLLSHFSRLEVYRDCHIDILVIDQFNKEKFNRGLLLNIGYKISQSVLNNTYDRYIFHDVDSYPTQELFNLYSTLYKKNIHYASPYLNYKYTYDQFMGGVIGMTKKSFEKINGFPNNFWGWGGEDDALRVRISKNNIVVYRPSEGEYILAPHDPPTKTEINEHKRKNRNYDSINWETDGLNTTELSNVKFYTTDSFFDDYHNPENWDGAEEPICERLTENINVYFITSNI